MKNTGQIIKAKPTGNYTVIPNEILQSKDLNLAEKGLLAFLLSCPSDWVIYKPTLCESLNEKKIAFEKAFKGLQKAGYILSVRVVGKNNQFIGWNHVVYDIPTSKNDENPCETTETPESRKSDFPKVGNPLYIQSTNNIQSTNKDKKDPESEKDSEPTSLFNAIKYQFNIFYTLHKKEDFYWSPKELGKINPIIKKLLFKIKEKVAPKESPDTPINDETVVRSFLRLLDIIKGLHDQWVFNNLSPSIIDSRFNEIIAQSKIKPETKQKEPEFTGPIPQDI